MADGTVNRSQYFVERSGGGQAKSLNFNSAYHRDPLSLPNCLRSSLLVLKPLSERLEQRKEHFLDDVLSILDWQTEAAHGQRGVPTSFQSSNGAFAIRSGPVIATW